MTERFKAMLRGDVERLSVWLAAADPRSLISSALMIVVGSALYGFTIGIWRARCWGARRTSSRETDV